MSLLPCESWHGETDIRHGSLNVYVHHDSIYVPARMAGYDPDFRWGLYKSSGEIITEAAYIRGPFFSYNETALVGQSNVINDDDRKNLEYDDGDYIYLGPLQEHYGHFLVAALARVWYLLSQKRNNRKLLFHTNSSISNHFTKDYFQTIMSALNIDQKDIAIFDRPMRLRSVYVPAPSFQELSYSYPAHAEVGRHIANELGFSDEVAIDTPVYFSKIRLTSGIWKFHNEEALVRRLEANGVRIVYPEEMSFLDQVRTFNQHNIICGLSGSALHTSMFALKKKNIIGISYENDVPSNFPLLDGVMGHTAEYFYPKSTIRVANEPHFHVGFEMPNPEGVADFLLKKMNYLS